MRSSHSTSKQEVSAIRPKPEHLSRQYAEQFKDWSVVDAYQFREPYPAYLFTILAGLKRGDSGAVLDVGCGTGDLARFLTGIATRVDAVDFSDPMITRGRTLSGGDHPNLRWIEGTVEEADLSPPYSLITAAESLHWMDWKRVFPRFRAVLPENGCLALIERCCDPNPWDTEVIQVIQRYSTNRDYRPYNLVLELEGRDLYLKHGSQRTAATSSIWSVRDYVESYHSRNGLSRDRMSQREATAFDRAMTKIVTPYARNGALALQTFAVVTWGVPLMPRASGQ